MNPFRSLRDYEEFVYPLRQTFSSVKSSTLMVVPRGRRTAVLRGQLIFECGYRLTAQERLSFDNDTVEIESYGYEIWHGSDKTAWYDSQPHPKDRMLQSSYPHHKHVPLDIKHNRIPAPQLSFAQPNLPVLIAEIEALVRSEKSA